MQFVQLRFSVSVSRDQFISTQGKKEKNSSMTRVQLHPERPPGQTLPTGCHEQHWEPAYLKEF